MMDAYQQNPDKWLATYHKRSTIESCFSAFKQRLGAGLTAMSERMMLIETALRIVAWNLTRITRQPTRK